jgi:hypothetical protein
MNIGLDIAPRDLQTDRSNNAGTVSALNQAEAVPALYPFALGGGSVGGAGSEAGTNALTAISINPAIFFADMNDVDESAKWGRLMDLTAIVPLNGISSLDSNRLEYFGLRGRINFTGAEKGGELYQNVITSFGHVLNSADIETDLIQQIIEDSPDCVRCAMQFQKVANGEAKAGSIESVCGSPYSVDESDEVFRSFKEDIDRLIHAADKKYFGLDLRADFGDPTLGAVENARGTSIFAGIGYGFSGDAGGKKKHYTSLHSRLGIRYKDMEDFEGTIFDIDGAAGFEFSWPYQFQQIKFGLGLEFRASLDEQIDQAPPGDLDQAFETDYLYFRTSLNVPITHSNGIGVQYGTSIVGDKSPILSVNFSWNLLLEDN